MILDNLILAQAAASSDAMTFWQLLQIGSFLTGVVCPIVILIVVLRNGKQKREVSFEFEPASKVDFEKHLADNRRDIDLLHSKVGSSERETRRQADEKVTKLSDDITKVSLQVAGIAVTNAAQSEQLDVINSDIKNMPSQIITQLRNTKGLL